MVSDHVLQLCTQAPTVSSEYAANPHEAPTKIIEQLYGHHKSHEHTRTLDGYRIATPAADLERAMQCGKWGPQRPSEFFVQVYHDALACLEVDPLSSMVSPPLMGSYGTIPLAVIAPLPDIVRHMANLIVRAEKEVILITCSWSTSIGSNLIADALRELSRRAGARNVRVVVKIMYDKAGPAQFMNPRQHVKAKDYSGKAIGLPKPEDIPNLDFEVINFHKPLLGTLHAKFMVVDRKIALVQSDNMEDNDNMEMMTHLEGPIVDSIYDTALITWGDAPQPDLPSANAPESTGGLNTVPEPKEALSTDRGPARELAEVARDGEAADLPTLLPGNRNYDPDLASEITRIQSTYSKKSNETHLQAINRALNLSCPKPSKSTGPEIADGDEFTPYIPIDANSTCPMALVSRPPFGTPNNSNTFVPQNEAWLSCLRNAKKSVFIQTPDLNAAQLHEALIAAIKRGIQITYYVCLGYNDAGEIMPGQGGTNEMFASKLTAALTPDERQHIHIYYYVGKDQDHPIHHNFHARSCHIKLLIADGHIGIQGSGNQDTQSWYHSQEINIMIDSEEICRKWREGIDRNQNTVRFGEASSDGVWRDSSGKEAPGSMGTPKPPISWMKGAIGMVKKAQGN